MEEREGETGVGLYQPVWIMFAQSLNTRDTCRGSAITDIWSHLTH